MSQTKEVSIGLGNGWSSQAAIKPLPDRMMIQCNDIDMHLQRGGGGLTICELLKRIFVRLQIHRWLVHGADLQYDLCYKLDNVSASLMRRHRLIYNTY